MTEIASWVPKVHERCFVYHGPVIYLSTVIAIHKEDSQYISFKKRGKVNYKQLIEELNEKRGQKINLIPDNLFSMNTYYVHYKDWSKDWDEWVTIDRMLPYDDENIKKAKEMKNEILKAGKSGKISISVLQDSSFANTAITDTTSLSTGHPEKINENEGASALLASNNINSLATLFRAKGESTSFKKVKEQLRGNLFTLEVPILLRKRLVQDCENIKLKKLLVIVPSKTPISDILIMYEKHFNKTTKQLKKTHNLNIESTQKRAGSEDYASEHLLYSEFLTEFISTIGGFFEKCIQKIILYDEEIDQFNQLFGNQSNKRNPVDVELTDSNKKCVDYYGVEHLLRMIMVLPSLLALQSPLLFIKDSEFEDVDVQCKSLLKFFLQSMLEFIDLKLTILYKNSDTHYYLSDK